MLNVLGLIAMILGDKKKKLPAESENASVSFEHSGVGRLLVRPKDTYSCRVYCSVLVGSLRCS